jgi:hypothetical protein
MPQTSNLEAVPNRLRESRNRFENARDIGLLGKATTRPFFAVYQYGLCEASFLVFGIGQPVLSAAMDIFGILFAVTSPVRAPGCSVLMLIL